MKRRATGTLILLVTCNLAVAETLVFDFESGPGPNFELFDAEGLWSIDEDGPELRIAKLADDGSVVPTGFASGGIKSKFMVDGDFTVTADFGLDTFPATGEKQLNESLMGVFRDGTPKQFELLRFRLENQNLLEVFAGGPLGVQTSTLTDGRYRIVRTGSSISGFIAPGSSDFFTGIASVADFTGPVTVQLFASQGKNPAATGRSTTPMDITFDNLVIEADTITGLVPEPSSIALAVSGLIVLAGWFVRRKRRSGRWC